MKNKLVMAYDENDIRAWLRLSLEPGIGSVGAKELLSRFGLPTAIFESSYKEIERISGSKIATQLTQDCSPQINEHIEKTLAWIMEPEHYIITLADDLYPRALLETHDPPPLFYLDGQLEALQRPAIAMVGARYASLGGEQNARAFGKYLAQQGWCVVSGLARGVDAAAHQGALDANEDVATIAVMGTGINRIYPAEHRDLAWKIKQQGALISELPLDSRAQSYHFPMRNRIVAGLARGVLVVEASQKSGSLLTAQIATEMGREVFAIPGSIHSSLSRGCHQLIKQGAKLVETGQDILEELGYHARTKMMHEVPDKGDVPIEFQRILDMMGFEAFSPNELLAKLGMTRQELMNVLLNMELQALLVRLPDGTYQQNMVKE